MSMSTYVKGIHPPDEQWNRMKLVWESCEDAGIDVPDEVQEFFDWERPDASGVILDIDEAVTEYKGYMQEGLEIDLSKLPSNVTHIRFINSW